MPRDPNSIPPAGIWASSGDVQTPTDAGITLAEGWDERYSEPGGLNPTRQNFNWLIRLVFSVFQELNKGLLEWDAAIAYSHPCYVLGSDGRIYKSERDSSNQAPTEAQSSYWKPLIASATGRDDVPVPLSATLARAGVVQLASAAETLAGTNAVKALTPLTLHALTSALNRPGLAAPATQDETLAGTNTTRFVVPSTLHALTANTERKGLIERATVAEAQAGTDTENALTPATLHAVLDARHWFGTRADFDTLTAKNDDTVYLLYEA